MPKHILSMKWQVSVVILLLLLSSTMAGINFPATKDLFFTETEKVSSSEREIHWLSPEHPPWEMKNVMEKGVGIENGRRVMIYYEDGNLKKEYIPESVDVYDFLIITPDEWASELQPLKEHKEKHGIKTMVVGLNEIYSGKYFTPEGRDDAEKIKYFIKDAIENWGVKYVMLVGSVYKMPIRNAVYKWRGSYKIETFLMPTDLYYADIYRIEGCCKVVFSSWDTNGNGIYGEDCEEGVGESDIIDLHPDVYLGRIACENKRVVRNVVKKIIDYENNAHGSEWFNRLILVGGDTFPGWGVVEGEFMNQLVAEMMDGFEAYRIWDSLGNLNALEIEKAMESGAGFLYYSGHGFPYGWGTHPINGSDEEWVGSYFTPYIMALFNNPRLPVIFLDACSTAKLDFNTSDLEEEGIPVPFDAKFPCFAWYFVRHPTGGGIASIGSTRVAFTGVDESGPYWGAGYLAYQFFKAWEKTNVLGEMFVEMQMGYIAKNPGDNWTMEEFILLGDPTLRIGGYE